MIFQQIGAGGDRNFGYLIGDAETGMAAVVDPSYSPEIFYQTAEKYNIRIVYIFGTHGHGDHVGGVAELKERTGAKIIMHVSSPSRSDIQVKDGDVIKMGNLEFKVIYTPGHTSDSICILVGNKLMTGDTLFVGKIGGTSTNQEARTEHDSLFNKLMNLDDDIEVYPGHDYGVAPKSNIAHERQTNPFLLRKDFKDFKWLKDNWLAYKKEYGIK